MKKQLVSLAMACAVALSGVVAIGGSSEAGALLPETDYPEIWDMSENMTSKHSTMVRFYWAVLGRVPDRSGVEYWTELLDDCEVDALDLAFLFSASPEFTARFGNEADYTNAQFAEVVYGNVLGRTPDAGGLAYWISQLDTGLTRSEFIFYVSASPEFVNTHPLQSDGVIDRTCGLRTVFPGDEPGPIVTQPTSPPTSPTTAAPTTESPIASHGPTDRHKCSDFASQAEAQEHFRQLWDVYGRDVDNLDGKNASGIHDGVACESRPAPRDTRPPDGFVPYS